MANNFNLFDGLCFAKLHFEVGRDQSQVTDCIEFNKSKCNSVKTVQCFQLHLILIGDSLDHNRNNRKYYS